MISRCCRSIHQVFPAHTVIRGIVLANSSCATNIRLLIPNMITVRSFHSANIILAGKGKKGGKGGSDDTAEPVALPDLKPIDRLMEDKIVRLVDEFSRIRGGRASPDIFQDLKIDAFGSKISLSEAGQIALPTPTKMTVTTYDIALAVPVSDAIRGCGLSLNPTTDGNVVTIIMPKPSAEARENFVKLASKAAEKFKQEIRQCRKDALDLLKKIKGKVSEDESRRFTKEVEALTEKKIEKVSKLLKDKEKDIKSD